MIALAIIFILKSLVISYALYGAFLTGVWYSKGHIEYGSWRELLMVFGWPYYRYYKKWSNRREIMP